ncbi:MAG: helix-turn-helix transcriptional regulator [Candidatus Sumerlaeota bacterium]|nr:helix-turn-helix transcriptional regulator [Candidatus Sumerlaeota bacterium]
MVNAQTKKGTRVTNDAIEILHHRYIKGKPEMEAMLEEESFNAEIARRIYDLRVQAGLSQAKLAKLIGTTASVICRLEDADYEGHSLTMLRKIAAALQHRVEVRIVPARKRQTLSSALT